MSSILLFFQTKMYLPPLAHKAGLEKKSVKVVDKTGH
jgi:hypothetical protein